VLLNLAIGEFEHLESVIESGLGGLSFREIIDYFLVREGLLDILIIKIYDGVAVRERFTLNTVVKNDLFLTIGVHSLDLAISSNVLVNNFGTGSSLGMILSWVLQAEIFLLFIATLNCLISLFFHLLLLIFLSFILFSLLHFKLLFLIIILFIGDLVLG
jgi:hypothetical protein